eukprot:1284955-Pleurochrysis_carterae.AAC.1
MFSCQKQPPALEAANMLSRPPRWHPTWWPSSFSPSNERVSARPCVCCSGEGEREVERLMSELKQRGALPT